MTAPRLACEVPFCRRTTRADGRFTAWICQRHWSAVSPRLRRLYAAAKRRRRQRPGLRSARLAARLFARCRAAAIEAAGGIG